MIDGISSHEAHDILDGVRAGINVREEIINAALLATGDLATQKSKFPDVQPMKTLLHIQEPRCAGREAKTIPIICPRRDSCARHRQMDTDRKLGIESLQQIKVYTLPYVRGQDCHFFVQA